MKARIWAVTMLGLFASGCGPTPQGVGFTGVGLEPVGAASQRAEADPRLSSPAIASSSLPQRQLSGPADSEPRLAARVLADDQPAQWMPVDLQGQGMLVSLVDTGGSRFLVVRPPRSLWGSPLARGTDHAVLAALPGLTGCHAVGNVYRSGISRTQPEALAVPLACG